MIMSTSGRVPGYPFSNVSRGQHAWQYLQTPFKHETDDPVQQAQRLS